MKKLLITLVLLLSAFFLIGQNRASQIPQIKPVVKLNDVEEQSTRIEVIKKTLPSVVTVRIVKNQTTPGTIEFDPTNPFGPLKRRAGGTSEIEQNIGSGFIIDKGGLIATNKHVVSDNQAKYQILTSDGKVHLVTKVILDPLNDLALLQIADTNLTPLKLGNSDALQIGTTVIAIGTPLGEFTGSVTTGIVSGLGRGINAGSPFQGFVERLDNVIQTDAAINPGNSGGPLINLGGEVIGVNTAVSQGSENIGFAIPVNVLADLLQKYNPKTNKIERPFLGIRYAILDKKTAKTKNLPQGALVIEVLKDSPAQKAELATGDIITEFDGVKLEGDSQNTLNSLIAKKKSGDQVIIKIWRNGKELSKIITLGLFE